MEENRQEELQKTPTKPSNSSKIIEIHSGKKKKEIKKFRNAEESKKLEAKNVTTSLVKSFDRKSGKLKTQSAEKGIQEFAKQKKEEAEILLNEQAKIFNKILWVRILSERVAEDNQAKDLKFDSKVNKERQNRLGKMKQETFKTLNYLEILEK